MKNHLRGKSRPLIIISEPNSKGDYLAIAGSTKIHQWFEEEHILIEPDMVLGGSLDKPTIFPASKQILIDSRFVRAQIGNIPVEYLEVLLRQCFSQYTKAFFQGVHAPRIVQRESKVRIGTTSLGAYSASDVARALSISRVNPARRAARGKKLPYNHICFN